MTERLKIIRNKYFAQYRSEQPISIGKHLDRMKRKNQTVQDFRFYLISSSCNSSTIEGSSLTEEDYMRFKEAKIISKDLNEVDDMIEAYRFARKHDITEEALLQAHRRMSKHLNIPARYQGVYRDRMVRVWNGMQVVYTAARTEIVEREMRKLLHDIDLLCRRDLTNEEIFYYASMIHLVLVSIHPFADGNGRMARLVEKWFLFKMVDPEREALLQAQTVVLRQPSLPDRLRPDRLRTFDSVPQDVAHGAQYPLILPYEDARASRRVRIFI